MRNTFLIILLAIIVSSCYNDRRENLNPQLPSNDTTSICDTIGVTYIKDIQPILSFSCTGCHSSNSASGGYSFDSEIPVKNSISKIITAISNGTMPQNSASLSTCKINKFIAWKNQGYK